MEAVAQTDTMTLHIDHGVLVVRILVKSVMHEFVLEDMKDQVLEQLPGAESGVLFDCSQLTLHVTSQFLGMLAAVRKHAAKQKLRVCVCCLGGNLKQAFEVAHFKRIIPVYPSAKEALLDLGVFDEWEKVRIETAAQYKAKHAIRPSQWNVLAAQLREKSPATLIGGTIAALLLLLGITWYTYQLFFAGPKLPRGYASYAGSQSAAGKVEGTVSSRDRGVILDGRGTIVVVWAAGFVPPRKYGVSSGQLFEMKEVSQTLAEGLTVARAGSNGQFSVEVRTPPDGDDFYVLLISATVRRSGVLPSKDDDLLSLYFANPAAMIGGMEYQLARCQVRSDRPARIEAEFGAAANSPQN